MFETIIFIIIPRNDMHVVFGDDFIYDERGDWYFIGYGSIRVNGR